MKERTAIMLQAIFTALISGRFAVCVLIVLSFSSLTAVASSQRDALPDAVQARRIIEDNPACRDLFTAEKSRSITINDFGLHYSSHDDPIHFVNIWATWCGPCRAELPLLVQLAETSPVSIDILNLGDTPDAIAKFAAQIHTTAALIATPAPADILQTINAHGLPYNALFYGKQLIGIRNQAIHDGAKLRACLTAIEQAE